MAARYLEDYAPGQRFGSGRLRVEAARIKSFAAEFDPQPFHLDEARARDTLFRGLAASGWHTAAMTMRLAHGLSHHEIGAKLGMTANAVQKSLARSLASFVRQLGRDGMDDPEATRDTGQPRERPQQAGARDRRGD